MDCLILHQIRYNNIQKFYLFIFAIDHCGDYKVIVNQPLTLGVDCVGLRVGKLLDLSPPCGVFGFGIMLPPQDITQCNGC